MQLITPNPHIPSRPGWCLAYVNEAFGVKKRYGTAIASWLNSPTQHTDYEFPALWIPVWFSLEFEPAGHVALRSPDGRYFSTTHPTSLTPTEHPSLSHLLNAYSRYNPLTYLGWTEDVEGTPVVSTEMAIQPQATIIESDDEMTDEDRANIAKIVKGIDDLKAMVNNVASAINEIKKMAEEAMLNARKIVSRVIDGK